MMKNEFYQLDKFLEILKNKLGIVKIASGSSEINTRCPFPNCDIDRKSNDHGHLYISLDVTSGPTFYCQRCNESGFILKLLRKLNIDPKEVLNLESETFKNSNYKKINTSGQINVSNIENLKVEESDFDLFAYKVNYLKTRLGSDYDIENIPRLVLNIRKFIEENKINLSMEDSNKLDFFNQYFVGFVTNRGTMLVLRNITDSEYKHAKILLTNDKYLFKDFYGIKTGFIKQDTNKIVICEGIFDLLVAIKSEALLDIKNNSCFWASSLGAHYKALIPSVLDHLKIPLCDVIILSDIDKEPEDIVYDKLREFPMINNIEYLYNGNKKDFGSGDIKLVKNPFVISKWQPNKYYKRNNKI